MENVDGKRTRDLNTSSQTFVRRPLKIFSVYGIDLNVHEIKRTWKTYTGSKHLRGSSCDN